MNQRQFAFEITQKLRQAGFEALWAGGCVRDQLLGITPQDYDVATNARPQQIRQIFGKKRTLAIGAAFGVITVLGPPSAGQIEVATFRTDASYSDGRHPDSIQFTDAAADAQRRDFTINGIFFDPLNERVIDYVGGQQDLQNGLVRAIGDPDHRIAEDKLRMLRAVRFAAKFRFQIEDATFQAIRRRAAGISAVSAERIGIEMSKMLGQPCREIAWDGLCDTGLAVLVCEFIRNPQHVDACRELGSRLLRQLELDSAETEDPRPAVALAALSRAAKLSGIAVDFRLTQSTCQKLKWPNRDSDLAAWVFEKAPKLAKAHLKPWSQIQPILVDSRAPDALQLAAAETTVQGEPAAGVRFCHQQLKRPRDQLDPQPLLSGRDLKEIGLRPGPLFKQILERVRQAQLDGHISSRHEALSIAREFSSERH